MLNILVGLTLGILIGIYQPDLVIELFEIVTGAISDNLS